MIDSYRNNIVRKRTELVRYQDQKAKKAKIIADQNKMILSVRKSISRTRNSSLISSKMQKIESCQNNISRAEHDISKLEKDIARKEKEIFDEQKKLQREEEREQKKREAETEKRATEVKRFQQNTQSILRQHDRLHFETKAAIRRLENLPKQITVLFIASNPLKQNSLELDEEHRKISEEIRKSKYRNSVKLEGAWAARPNDLLSAINEFNPTIVHFSGHGTPTDKIVFQGSDGKPKFVDQEAIIQTIFAAADDLRIVFLNSCYSKNTAKAVVDHVEASIGMGGSIGDKAARIFSAQFYSALGFGKSVKNAFEQAKAALMLEGIKEEDTPVLFLKDGIDGDQLIIVNPGNRSVSL